MAIADFVFSLAQLSSAQHLQYVVQESLLARQLHPRVEHGDFDLQPQATHCSRARGAMAETPETGVGMLFCIFHPYCVISNSGGSI